LTDFLVERDTGSRSLSGCSIISLTTGSGSNNSILPLASFSPDAQYFSIRISRRRFQHTNPHLGVL
jgi:hypothetical protein